MSGLTSNRALHYDAGVEHVFTRNIEASVEGFYKQLDNLVEPGLGNTGSGVVYGGETLIRYRPDERFFGWVAYTLFHAQTDRHLAGLLVGKLFTAETYLGLAVGVVALLLPGRTKFIWGYLAVMLLAVNEWTLRRLMDVAHARGAAWGLSFGAWHGVSAALYALACIAVVILIWRQDFR